MHNFPRRTQLVHGLSFCNTASHPSRALRQGLQLVVERRPLMMTAFLSFERVAGAADRTADNFCNNPFYEYFGWRGRPSSAEERSGNLEDGVTWGGVKACVHQVRVQVS